MRPVAAILVTGFIQQCLPQPPQVEPPEAHIEVACASVDCLVVELQGDQSPEADEWRWVIDGVDYGTDPVIAIDLPGRGLTEVELEVTNSAGSSATSVRLFTTEVVPLPGDDGSTGGFDPAWATVVVGAQACDTNAVVSTIGGCFTGPAPLEHHVLRDRFGVVTRSVLVYDPVANNVTTPGYAVAAVWRNNHDPATYPNHSANLNFYNSSASDYGPPPRPYRSIASGDQITSYYPLGIGDILEIDFQHGVYFEDPQRTPLDRLRLDCSAGSLSVDVQPLDVSATGI
jgi:hypothetical protein